MPHRHQSSPTCTPTFWGERSGREITPREAEEILHNVCGFIRVLAEWDIRKEEAPNVKTLQGQCDER